MGKIEKDNEVFSLYPQRKRSFGATNLNKIFTWVDTSYAVHPDIKSQFGGTMSMGLGVTNCRSSKKKMNTKGSTESELVGVSDYLTYSIWYITFMHHQGYLNKSNKFFQDNQSSVRMEMNGRKSCTGNSCHIDIIYLFINYRLDKGELSIMYHPIHIMLADYFTKPLREHCFIISNT